MVGCAQNISEFRTELLHIYLWMNFGKVSLPGAVDYEWTSRDRISRWNTAIHIPQAIRTDERTVPSQFPLSSLFIVRPRCFLLFLFPRHLDVFSYVSSCNVVRNKLFYTFYMYVGVHSNKNTLKYLFLYCRYNLSCRFHSMSIKSDKTEIK